MRECLLRNLKRSGHNHIVVVCGHIDDDALMRAVELGVSGLLRRSEATPERLSSTVVAAARGDGQMAPDLLGRLLEQMSRLQQRVLAPKGISPNGFTSREIEVLRLLAEGYDTAAIADQRLIIPLVLLAILVILMLLLRAIVAPLVLIASVVLSFAAALGVSTLVFEYVFGFPGADPSVPLFGFVFLVALGVDYNIFLMTRVREESIAHGTREGILRGLRLTGGVITSAGIVLAGTFSVLAVLPLVALTQIGITVAFGVLLDTFVVRSILVPALTFDLSDRIWWPSRLARRRSAAQVASTPRSTTSGQA